MPSTRIDFPFTSAEQLLATMPHLLSPEGIFIQTGFPPPLNTIIEMKLVVGPEKKEMARFQAQVISHQAKNPALAQTQGVELKFTRLAPNAIELFSRFVKLTHGIAPAAAPAAQTSSVTADNQPPLATSPQKTPPLAVKADTPHDELVDESEDEIKDEDEEIMTLSEEDMIPSEPEMPSMQNLVEHDLAAGLTEFATRPLEQGTEFELSEPGAIYQGAIEFSDNLAEMQGRGGYEMSDLIFGIDLGTCYSCVSVVKDGALKVLADDDGYNTIPSVVSFTEDGKIIVGREAQKLLTKYPRTTVFGAKRFIGRNYHSPVVQKMIQFFPYKVVPDDKNHPAIDIFGKPVSLEIVSSEILKQVVSIGQDAIKEEVDKVIITVPAYYSDNQRAAVKNAGALAGLNVIRIINEPTAAALAVGFNQNMNKRVLIYDLGGGTFDVSVLEIKDDNFKVVATGGDTFLGGEDFDNRLVKWVLESSRDEKIFLARNAITFERIKQACEMAKRDLSEKKETGINLPYIQTADNKTLNFQKHIQREQLVNLTRDLVEKSIRICDMVLEDAKMTIADIDEVVLVGGMTRMPFVKNSVHQHYGKKPFGDVNPDEAVSMGAAILGGGQKAKKQITLSDVLSMSIGVALPRNRFKPILTKNTPVPCGKKYKISADLSAEYSIDVFQGDSEKCDNNEYLGTLVFSDRVKSENLQSLEIEFELSAECLLSCTIRNPLSGKAEKALLMTHDTPPSAKLI